MWHVLQPSFQRSLYHPVPVHISGLLIQFFKASSFCVSCFAVVVTLHPFRVSAIVFHRSRDTITNKQNVASRITPCHAKCDVCVRISTSNQPQPPPLPSPPPFPTSISVLIPKKISAHLSVGGVLSRASAACRVRNQQAQVQHIIVHIAYCTSRNHMFTSTCLRAGVFCIVFHLLYH